MSNLDFTDLIYDEVTGLFFRSKQPNTPIGTVNKGGYIVFKHKGTLLYAHRVAFAISHGHMPPLIDHINGIKSDNRIANLRDASATLNSRNRKAFGATKPKQTKRWAASITVDYKRKHLGYFDTPELAHEEYIKAKAIHHPNALVNLPAA